MLVGVLVCVMCVVCCVVGFVCVTKAVGTASGGNRCTNTCDGYSCMTTMQRTLAVGTAAIRVCRWCVGVCVCVCYVCCLLCGWLSLCNESGGDR